jgi:hypothetical protein
MSGYKQIKVIIWKVVYEPCSFARRKGGFNWRVW